MVVDILMWIIVGFFGIGALTLFGIIIWAVLNDILGASKR